jgi:hypothetical protein
MELTMLAKDKSSGDQGCPSAYLGADKLVHVQARKATPAVYAAAINMLNGEEIVSIEPQVILDAAARLRDLM